MYHSKKQVMLNCSKKRLQGKETTFAMWKILIDLFKSKSDVRKSVLRDKPRNIPMGKNETID